MSADDTLSGHIKKYTPGKIASWCLYDFANSSYSAVIAAVIFPVYYVTIIAEGASGHAELWWGWSISASMAFVAVTSPFLGGIADYSGKRKRFLLFYTLLAVFSVAALSLLKPGMIVEGFFIVFAANIGLEGGLVFYNSFLPEIAEKEKQGRVSAWGYGVGYGGSILSLMIALLLVNHSLYSETWLMVAMFFMLFSLPAFLILPSDRKDGESVLFSAVQGGKYSWNTLKKMLTQRQLRRFLCAYLVYEDGVVTVIVFSSIFASKTLGFATTELIVLYMVVQLTALAGAFMMAKPIDRWGPKKIVLASLLLWSAVAVSAYFISSKVQFMVLASCAGLGLGTIQAASRAFFTQFVPQGKENEYFGVYSFVGKSSAIIGPNVFASVSALFGSQRPAILALSLFFVFGLIITAFVKGGGPNISAG